MADQKPLESRSLILDLVPLRSTAEAGQDEDLVAAKYGATDGDAAPSRRPARRAAPDEDAIAAKYGAYEPGQEYRLDERGRRREVDPFGNLVPRSFRSGAPAEVAQSAPGRRPLPLQALQAEPRRRSLSELDYDAFMAAERGEVTPEAGAEVGNLGVSLARGVIGVPEAVVGLVDIPTGGRVGKALEDSAGYRPAEAKKILDSWYSDQYQQARRDVSAADGVLETAVKALSNLDVVLNTVVESLPGMFAGGAAGRMVAGGRAIAGGLGEGLVAAGSAAADYRDEDPNRLLPARKGAYAAATGATTTFFGALGNRVAKALGIQDIDTLVAATASDPVAAKNLARGMLLGAFQEGVLEELPQGFVETMLANRANGRDLLHGVDESIVLGLLSGGLMGAAGQASGGVPLAGPGPRIEPLDRPESAPGVPDAIDLVEAPVSPTVPPALPLADLGDETAPPEPPAPDVEALLAEADQLDAESDAKAAARTAPTYTTTTEGVGSSEYSSSNTGVYLKSRSERTGKVSHYVLNALGEFVPASKINRRSDADIEEQAFSGEPDVMDLIARLGSLAADLNTPDAVVGRARDLIAGLVEGRTTVDDALKTLEGAAPPEPTIEVLDDAPTTENASGESAASAEALSRQEGMKARGETFMVYDRAGRRRPILGPEAVDYQPKKGETFGIEGPDGFRVLTDNGGKVVQKSRTPTADLIPSLSPFGPPSSVVEAPPTGTPSNAALLDDARERITNGAVVSPEDAQTLRDLAQEEADANAGAIDGRPDAELSDEELAARLMQRMEAENAPKAPAVTSKEKATAPPSSTLSLKDRMRSAADARGFNAREAGVPRSAAAKEAEGMRAAWETGWDAANETSTTAIDPNATYLGPNERAAAEAPTQAAVPPPYRKRAAKQAAEKAAPPKQDTERVGPSTDPVTSSDNLPPPEPGWAHQGIYIKLNPTGREKKLTTREVAAQTRDGLAVHPAVRLKDSDPVRWNVTHVASGVTAMAGFRSEADAFVAANAALKLDIDWTADAATVQARVKARPELKQQIGVIYNTAQNRYANEDAQKARKAPAKKRSGRPPFEKTPPGGWKAEDKVSVKAPKASESVTEIGKNADGQTVYEDGNGVRSIVIEGVRQTEAVGMRPTREGMKTSVSRNSDGEPTREEYRVVKAPAKDDYRGEDLVSTVEIDREAERIQTLTRKAHADKRLTDAESTAILDALMDAREGMDAYVKPDELTRIAQALTDAAKTLSEHITGKDAPTAKKPVTPQVPALGGMAPLGAKADVIESRGAAADRYEDGQTIKFNTPDGRVQEGTWEVVGRAGDNLRVRNTATAVILTDVDARKIHRVTVAKMVPLKEDPQRAALDAKRAQAKEEIAAAAAALRAELKKANNSLNTGLPTPPAAVVVATVKLVRLYAKVGIIEVEAGWESFKIDMGELADSARQAFQFAWESVYGTRPDAALLTTEDSDAGNRGDADGGRLAADRGEAADAVRGDGEGALGETSSIADAVAEDDAEGTGSRGAESDAPVAVSGRPGGSEDGDAPNGAGTRDEGPALPATRVGTGEVAPAPPSSDYQLTPERLDAITNRTDLERAVGNVAAIELVQALRAEGRHATPDEQEVLAKYVGWGSSELSRLLGKSTYGLKGTWLTLYQKLQNLTTEDERDALKHSSLNAHYTYGIYKPLWEALERAGFTQGRVLEPSVGTGHAFGAMPADMRAASTLRAVELEPFTAAIAQALYPSARVQNAGYQKAALPTGAIDLAISNVPFGNYDVVDLSKPDFVTEYIHNYFFDKALDHVRPGGLVVFVTSKGTMDQSGGQQFRRHLMSRAHFIGSVRLPGGDEGAFSEGAKTAVVTDLIVLQRKLADQDTHPNDDLFIDLATVKLPSKSGDSVSGVKRSAWYSAHPELVIGREAMTGKMYGRPNGYNVDPVENFDAEFARALAAILPAGTYKPRQQQELDRPRTAADETARVNEFVVKDGKLFQVDENRELMPMTLAKESQARVVGMVGVRDALKQLRATMRDPASTDADVKAGQATLKKLYTAFTKKHGLLNKKVNVDLFALDPESPNILGLEIIEPKASVETNKNGEEKVVVTRTLKALSAIFEKRVIGPRSADLSAKTAKDALLMSLGATMRVDWAFMARVRGQSESVMQAELLAEGLVFEQPDGTWVTSDEYLSGDVVTKLADARAEGGAKMARNITALEAIQPVPKKPGEVPIMLGSTYVPADVYMDFLADTLGLNRAGITQKRDDSVALAGTSQVQQWGIPSWSHEARGVAANHPLSVEYGPALAVADEKFPFGRGERYTLLDLFGDAMNLRQPKATYTVKVDKTTKTVEVPEATAALRANLDEVQGLFDAWLVAHPQTHTDLTTLYNDRYNREVPRVFDGAHLAPVLRANGMSLPFDLHKHQINAIWRALATGNTLLGHEVGAGKTYEMIGIAMEMRRTGRASKPMITVPTHIVDDVKKATIEMYPDAKILSFESEDLGGKKRRAAMARIANGDWDIVLVPHSSFTLLSSSPESRNRLLKQWIREAEEAYEATYRRESGNDSSPAVKAAARVLAKVKGTLEKKIEQAAAKKDDNLYWEDLGVDALIVDEAHSFKNLFFLTNMDPVRGVSQSNAMKSLDVYVKVQSINQASGYRNLIFATATPLMNSMVEAFTMQRYLQPQTLAAAGAESFENWYRLFGKAGMVTEPLPDGTYREVLRVKEFRNLDALSKMFRKVMDYIGWDNMPYLQLPKAVFHVVETPKHPMYDSHLLPNFALRIAVLKQQPSIVNHIKKTYTAPLRAHPLTGQPIPGVPDLLIQVLESAKQAAIDARLIFGGAATDFRQSRIQTAADRMFASYKKNKASKGVQLAFMDVGIPKNPGTLPFLSNAAAIEADDETDEEMSDDETGDEAEFGGIDYSTGFNLYDALRDALIQRGVPATEIAYLHQARNGAERRALFDAANEGKVRFVFASTEKGGVGMNIQRRMSDIHAIDAPRFLRPGDEQQRLGRGIRQGNIFEEVHIHRYVTKGTSDEWLLQVLGIKRDVGLAFMRGVAVEFQEPDASSVSLDEAMARASGDERAIERIELKASYQRVKAQADGQRRAVAMAVGRVNNLRAYVADLRKRKERAEDFIRDSFRSLKGDQFEIAVGGKTYADRKEATEALRAVFYTFIGDTEVRYTSDPQKRIRPIGEIGGLPLSIRFEPAPSWRSEEAPTAVIELDATGIGGDKLRVVGTFAVEKAVDEFNLSMSAQNRYEDVGRLVEELSEKLSKAEIDLGRTEDIIDNPPAIIARSEQMKARIAVLDAALASDSEEKSKALIEKARAYLNNGGRLVRDLKAKAPAAGKAKASGPKGPSGDASVAPAVQMVVRAGLSADLPATTSKQMGGLTTAKPAAVPELVAFIDEVGGGTKIMRSLRAQGARGMHSEGFITLVADLFKAGNKVELARVLAHEIGHLIDWLPDGDMKRGNVLGRLRSLHAFLKHRYTNADGDTIKVQTVRDELLALSKEWRPWPDDAPASYHAYRKRGRELYADAISALLNDPLAVKETAPTFFAEFFNELDNKPEVKTAYLDLMELLSGTPEELRARRRGRVRGMFDRGNAKSLDLVALAMAEKEQRAYSLWQKLKIDHYEKHGAIADRVDQWEKVHGRKVSPEDDPRLLLSEMAHIRGGVKGFVNEHFEPVYAALREADIDWNTFGEVLFYDRILAGDASETANPGGLSPEHVQDMRDDAVNSLSAKQRAVIETQADAFRGALRLVAEQAHEAGLYTDEMYEQMQKNPAYVTFRVLDYLDQNVTSSVYRRTGSLKDIQHVAESSIVKAIVTLKAAEHNRTKRDVFQWFEANVGKDEGGFERATMRWNGKGWEPAEPKDRRLKLITFKVKGKPAGVYVDAYVAKSFETLAPEDLGVILRGLRLVTGKFMRPVFTTMNPGFMTFNVVRDFLRAWKAMPQWSFRQALTRYAQAVPMAAARAVPMRPGQKGAAWRQRAEAALKAAESAKILDLTLADIHGEDRIEDTNIDQVFADVGISSYAAEEGRLRRVLGWVEAVGDFIETLPKAAAIIEMTGGNTFPDPIDVKLLDPAERNKIRDRVGSPDFQQGGAQTPRSNGLFIFSNAIIRGIAGDLKTASEPETAAGWWFKTAMVNIAPKLLTAGLLYAALGGGDDDDEEDNWLEYGQRILRGVSEYDFTNYNIVPLGLDEYGESIYARIPQDDFGRLIGGLAWKAISLAGKDAEDRDAIGDALDVFDFTAGQLPGMNPMMRVPVDIAQVLSGNNVYDSFRSRMVFTPDEVAARDERMLKKFVGYEFQQLGGSIVWRFIPGDERHVEKGTLRKVVEFPIVSNVMGRWIRVGDRGKAEALRGVTDGVKRDEARARLDERQAVNRAIAVVASAAPPDRARVAKEQAREIMAEVHESLKGDAAGEKQRAIEKKLKFGLARGSADPYLETLMSQTSNAQKVAVVVRAKRDMTPPKFQSWLRRGVAEGVISKAVETAARKAK